MDLPAIASLGLVQARRAGANGVRRWEDLGKQEVKKIRKSEGRGKQEVKKVRKSEGRRL